MDAQWASVVIAAVGMVLTGVVAYQAALRGTAVALARGEEKSAALKDQVVYLTEQKDAHAEILGELGVRVGILEHRL